MKKWLIGAILIFLAVLIALGVFLIVRFLSLYGEMQTDTAETTAQSADIVAYAKEHWPEYDPLYDPETCVLTLSKTTAMTYDAACAYGGSVYTEESAPETFLSSAAYIAFDVAANCGEPSLTVTLRYLSAEGKPILTVSSGGEIRTCWETDEP